MGRGLGNIRMPKIAFVMLNCAIQAGVGGVGVMGSRGVSLEKRGLWGFPAEGTLQYTLRGVGGGILSFYLTNCNLTHPA